MIEQLKTFSGTINRPVTFPYILTLPDRYGAAERKWPLILFLHGAGERGTDVNLVRQHGIPRMATQFDEFPFITVSPQCPENHWWSDYLEALIALVDMISNQYAVDPDRIYLTGLSMGGYGTWHLAASYPDRFAAIAPICGGGLWAYGFPERVRELKHVPVWVFHGALDDVVPLSESEVLVRELEAAGGQVRFTVYSEADHDSWTQTYNNPDLYTWFLSHRRGTSASGDAPTD
ncbi:MAG: prolyl oligopeptidase family serine peptidase [Anaerolineae bacterium]